MANHKDPGSAGGAGRGVCFGRDWFAQCLSSTSAHAKVKDMTLPAFREELAQQIIRHFDHNGGMPPHVAKALQRNTEALAKKKQWEARIKGAAAATASTDPEVDDEALPADPTEAAAITAAAKLKDLDAVSAEKAAADDALKSNAGAPLVDRHMDDDGSIHGVSRLRKIEMCVSEEQLEYLKAFDFDVNAPEFDGWEGHEKDTATTPHPAMMTFHGTSSPETADSILRHGFLTPGEQHPAHGYALSMRVGNVYGDGVYSTTDEWTAMWYAEPDLAGTIRLIVSCVVPGKIGLWGDTRETYGYQKATGNKLMVRKSPNMGLTHHAVLDTRRDGYLPGLGYHACSCCDSYHKDQLQTLTPDFSMWVTASRKHIVPLAVIEVSMDMAMTSECATAVASARAFSLIEPLTKAERRKRVKADTQLEIDRLSKELNQTNAFANTVFMTRLSDDLFVAPASVVKAVTAERTHHRIFVVPRSLLFDRSFAEGLKAHIKEHALDTNAPIVVGKHREFHPQASVVIYGAAERAPVVISAQDFAKGKYVPEMVREKNRPRLDHGVDAAMNIVTKADDLLATYHCVQLFCDGGDLTEAECDALLSRHAVSANARYVNMKFAFSRQFSPVKQRDLLHRILRLKALQMEGIFEEAFHVCNTDAAVGTGAAWAPKAGVTVTKKDDLEQLHGGASPTWPVLLAALETEFTNIGRAQLGSYIGDFRGTDEEVSIPGHYRIFGEGFLREIGGQVMPSASGTMACVFKGTPPQFLNIGGRSHSVRVVNLPLLQTLMSQARASVQEFQEGALVEMAEAGGAAEQRVLRSYDRRFRPATIRSEHQQEDATRVRAHKTLLEDVGKMAWSEFVAKYCANDNLVRFAARLQADIKAGARVMVMLLARCRNQVMSSRLAFDKASADVQRYARAMLQLATESTVLDLVDSRAIATDVAMLTTEMAAIARTPFHGRWFAAFQQMRHGRALLKRQQRDLGAAAVAGGEKDPAVLLSHLSGITLPLVPVRLVKAASSEIEPWAAVVEYVSVPSAAAADSVRRLQTERDAIAADNAEFVFPDFDDGDLIDVEGCISNPQLDAAAIANAGGFASLSRLVRAGELRRRLRDRHGEGITDGVLVTAAIPEGCPRTAQDAMKNRAIPMRTAHALRHYYAYALTRNPSFVLGSQMNALITVTWVRATESILHRIRQQKAKAAPSKAQKTWGTEAPIMDVAAFCIQAAAGVAQRLARSGASEDLQVKVEVPSDPAAAVLDPAQQEAALAEAEAEGMGAALSSDLDGMARQSSSFMVLPDLGCDAADAGTESDGFDVVDDDDDAESDAAPAAARAKSVVVPGAVSRDEVLAAPSLCRVLGRTLAVAHAQRQQVLEGGTAAVVSIPSSVRFDLLAESIVRLVHSYAKSLRRTNDELLRWVLGFPIANGMGPASMTDAELDVLIDTMLAALHGEAVAVQLDGPRAVAAEPKKGASRTAASPDAATAHRRIVDLSKSARRTGKLFNVSFNNCSPFAVVAALGFQDHYARGADAAALLAAFEAGEVGMGRFLAASVPAAAAPGGWDSLETQAALFLFAAATHNGGLRRPAFSSVVAVRPEDFDSSMLAGARDGLLSSPRAYVAKTVADVLISFRRTRTSRALLAARMHDRMARRGAINHEKKESSLRRHNVPVLFTKAEVDKLNEAQRTALRNAERAREQAKSRGEDVTSAEDAEEAVLPYELMSNGLLKHHCCYPECPGYLKCFASRNDIRHRYTARAVGHAATDRRRGIQKHLQDDFLAHRYCPAFHNVCRTVMRRTASITYEHFARTVGERLAGSDFFKHLDQQSLEGNLRAAFKFHGENRLE